MPETKGRFGTAPNRIGPEELCEVFRRDLYGLSRKHKVRLSTQFDKYCGKALVTEFGHRSLSQISPRMIEDYLVNLLEKKTKYDKPHSPVTVRRHFNMLNQIFNMAIRERITNDNPCRLVSRMKKLPTW